MKLEDAFWGITAVAAPGLGTFAAWQHYKNEREEEATEQAKEQTKQTRAESRAADEKAEQAKYEAEQAKYEAEQAKYEARKAESKQASSSSSSSPSPVDASISTTVSLGEIIPGIDNKKLAIGAAVALGLTFLFMVKK